MCVYTYIYIYIYICIHMYRSMLIALIHTSSSIQLCYRYIAIT